MRPSWCWATMRTPTPRGWTASTCDCPAGRTSWCGAWPEVNPRTVVVVNAAGPVLYAVGRGGARRLAGVAARPGVRQRSCRRAVRRQGARRPAAHDLAARRDRPAVGAARWRASSATTRACSWATAATTATAASRSMRSATGSATRTGSTPGAEAPARASAGADAVAVEVRVRNTGRRAGPRDGAGLPVEAGQRGREAGALAGGFRDGDGRAGRGGDRSRIELPAIAFRHWSPAGWQVEPGCVPGARRALVARPAPFDRSHARLKPPSAW